MKGYCNNIIKLQALGIQILKYVGFSFKSDLLKIL